MSSFAIIVIEISPQPTTRENADYYFAWSMAASILTPLTGALNALVYIRPRYRALTGPNGPLNMSKLRFASRPERRALNGPSSDEPQPFDLEISRVSMAQFQSFEALDSFHEAEGDPLSQ